MSKHWGCCVGTEGPLPEIDRCGSPTWWLIGAWKGTVFLARNQEVKFMRQAFRVRVEVKAIPLSRQEAGPSEGVVACSETEFAGCDIRAIVQMNSPLM